MVAALGQPAPGRIGILSLQGDTTAHASAFADCGAPVSEVKRPCDLATIEGLVLPGGESTALLRLLGDLDSWSRGIQALLARGGGLFATCAGLILLARIVDPPQPSLGLLDIAVARNGWGRQLDSFETALSFDGGDLEAVFIRAPRIVELGPGVSVLAALDGEPVLVRQGTILAATFHPELTGDRRLQRAFLDILAAAGAMAAPGTMKRR